MPKQSNKVIARRKQELRFVEGKLWALRLLEAMLSGVTDPKLIRREMDNLKHLIDIEHEQLKQQIEGGEVNDKRSNKQPTTVSDDNKRIVLDALIRNDPDIEQEFVDRNDYR